MIFDPGASAKSDNAQQFAQSWGYDVRVDPRVSHRNWPKQCRDRQLGLLGNPEVLR
jgi:hypothetical protein